MLMRPLHRCSLPAVSRCALPLACTLLSNCTLQPLAAAETEQAQAADCKARIIVGLAQAEPSPDEKFVTDLAHAAGVQLTFIRTVGRSMYVFSLMSAESDPGCREALERLRRDARVRSVEMDARRARHAREH